VQLFYYFPDEDYKAAFTRVTRNTIRDTVAKYEAFEFVFDQTALKDSMQDDLTVELTNYYAQV
jgi:hypothetical protein